MVRYELIVPSGEQISNELSFNQLRFAGEVTITAPDDLASETHTVESARSRSPGSGDWADLEDSSGSPITMNAGQALPLPGAALLGLRINSDVNAGADRVFAVAIQEVALDL